MSKSLVLLFLILSFPPLFNARDTESSAHVRVSEILFPETRTWTAIESYPSPDFRGFETKKSELRSAYQRWQKTLSPGDDASERSDCSQINSVLYEHFEPQAFRVGDIDGDGSQDLVFSGPARCREGDVTIIWPSWQSNSSNSKAIVIFAEILKVENGKDGRISSIEIGCCADYVDTYFLGKLTGYRQFAYIRTLNYLELPKGITLVSTPHIAKKELVLRSSLVKEDQYDKDRSEFIGRAIFGNIIAKYLAGASGTVVATAKDYKGVTWNLVIMHESSLPFLFYAPYDVNVGWMSSK
jgi:hypothetical protein